MSIAHTSAFIPQDPAHLRQVLVDCELTEDLGVRPGPTPGTVIVYALHGASSWPYEWLVDDEQREFDIVDFLSLVAAGDQSIEASENGETLVIGLGCPAGG